MTLNIWCSTVLHYHKHFFSPTMMLKLVLYSRTQNSPLTSILSLPSLGNWAIGTLQWRIFKSGAEKYHNVWCKPKPRMHALGPLHYISILVAVLGGSQPSVTQGDLMPYTLVSVGIMLLCTCPSPWICTNKNSSACYASRGWSSVPVPMSSHS